MWQTLLALSERLMAWTATSGLRIILILALSIAAARVLKALCNHLRAIFAGGEEGTGRNGASVPTPSAASSAPLAVSPFSPVRR
jgi:hypothetical protein